MQAVQNETREINGSQIAAYKAKLVAERFDAAIKKEVMPRNDISILFMDAVAQALACAAPYTLRIELSDYTELVRLFGKNYDEISISLFHFGCLSNALEATSMQQLGFCTETYVNVLEEQARHVAYWNKCVTMLKETIEKQVGAEVAEKLTNAQGRSTIKTAEA